MNESKFDSEIKRILFNAEAPVSPSAWDGIASRLPAKKVAFPIWRYVSAAGIAAVIAAGVFLLKPKAAVEEDVTADVIISQEIPSITEQIEATAAKSAVARTELPSVPKKAGFEAPTAPEAPVSAVHSVPEKAVFGAPTEPEAVTEQASGVEPAATAVQDTSDDDRLLAQLSAEEENSGRGRIHLTASTNLQGTERQAKGGNTVMRAPAKMPEMTKGVTREDPEYNFSLPVTIGAGIRFCFGKHWSIGTGLQYTNMSRSFIGDYRDQQDDGDIFELENTNINNMQHWLGIPLNVCYDFLPESKWSVHLFAGGSAEYLLDNHYLVHTSGNDIHYSDKHGFQFSVGGGVGVEYRITPYFGLYFDPSLRYYFNNNAPRSIRTIQPLRLDFQAGVRFTL